MKFMDFCAGIGGGRFGLENIGFECVAYSEIDDDASKTYSLFFDDKEINYGDLMKINPHDLPYFDLMIAGFPCQTFSIAGKREGLADQRGLIIYGLIKILKAKKVKYFLFENVKGLVNHNKGKTLMKILDELDKAGYIVEWKLLNSLNYGVPQMRERVYFIGIRKDLVHTNVRFSWPDEVETPDLKWYLCDTENSELEFKNDTTFNRYLNNKYNAGKFDLNEILKKDYLILDTRQSDLRLYRDKVPTLRAGRHGILYVKDRKLRKLSGYESLLLQGFPSKLALRASESIAESRLLSQAGNAMTVSVISSIGSKMLEYIWGSSHVVA